MKLLVVGSAGQVGRNLVEMAVRAGDEVIATYNVRQPQMAGVATEALDKTDAAACRTAISRHRPDVVVDTGALHNVDYCETHPEEALRVNRDGTRNLAEATRAVEGRFVFVSTDFVFDGMKSTPYREEDPVRPISAYAESKVAGEQAVLASGSANLVVRPSVIYSWLDTRNRQESSSGKGMNFGTWLVEEVAHGRSVRIINDQVASPTLAADLAGGILSLVARNRSGVFHAAGATAVNRHEFSVRLVERLGLDPSLVRPVATAELNQKARRPVNSALDSDRLAGESGYRTMSLPGALDRFYQDYSNDPGAVRPA